MSLVRKAACLSAPALLVAGAAVAAGPALNAAGAGSLPDIAAATPTALAAALEAGWREAGAVLDDLELASRLSFFLWSQRPDEELLELALAGRLSDPAVLQTQVRRMLDAPQASALVENFAIKWLNLDNLNDVDPNPQLFPEYSDGLLRDFSEESNRFIASVLLNDQPVPALMTADYTFLNERLAKHYGIPNVYGSRFRRVALDSQSRRGGLLRQGSVLTVTSYATRTSPAITAAASPSRLKNSSIGLLPTHKASCCA